MGGRYTSDPSTHFLLQYNYVNPGLCTFIANFPTGHDIDALAASNTGIYWTNRSATPREVWSASEAVSVGTGSKVVDLASEFTDPLAMAIDDGIVRTVTDLGVVPPSTPGSFTVVRGGVLGSVYMNWRRPTSGTPPFTYQLERATDAAFTTPTVVAEEHIDPDRIVSFSDLDLLDSTQYWYRLKSVGPSGLESAYTPIENATTVVPPAAPPAPVNLTVTQLNGAGVEIQVRWSGGYSVFNLSRFEIQRATNTAFTQGLITHTTKPTRNVLDRSYYHGPARHTIIGFGPV